MQPRAGRAGALLIFLTLLLGSLPYLYGWIQPVPNMSYTGMRELNASDYNVNLSWIEQFRRREFFLRNLFTSEPHRGFLIRPVYAVLSFPFSLAAADNGTVFHILRILCGAILLLVVYRLLAYFIPDEKRRLLAFALLCFSSGAGFLFYRWIPSADLEIPEYFLFLSLGEAPHFLYSLLFLWVGIVAIYRASLGWHLGIPTYAAMLLLLCLEHPFDAITLAALGGMGTLFMKSRKHQIATVLLTVIICGGSLLYYRSLQNIPAFAGWASQNLMPAPPWVSVLSGFFPLSVLAFFGARHLWTSGEKRLCTFLVMWILVQLILSRAPVSFQRRLLAGVQLPLVILSTFGIGGLKPSVSFALILVLSLSNWHVTWGQIRFIQSAQMPFYMPNSYAAAFDWLKRKPEAAVLSGYITGNFIPANTGHSVFAGHSALTPTVQQKRRDLMEFYRHPNREFLIQNRIRYVWIGFEERIAASGNVTSLKNQGLAVVFQNQDVMLLEFPK